MTTRTRRFVYIGVTVLVLGLGTGMVASYVGLPNLGALAGNGPAELAYIPSDATVVAFADVRGIMDSGVRQKLLKLSPDADSGADEFQAETGIDIQRDVNRIVAAVSGTDPSHVRPLVLARGVFDTARIEASIRAKGGTVEQYNRQRLIILEKTHRLSFVEPHLALVGEPNAVKRAIDTKASGKNVTGNEQVMRLVREFDSGNAWAVAHVEAVTNADLIPAELKQQLPPVTWLAINGHVDDGIRASIRAETRDEAAANNLRDVIRGVVALARMQAGQHAQLAEVVNSLELGGQGTTVSLGFTVPPSVIDLLGVLRAQPQQTPEKVVASLLIPGL